MLIFKTGILAIIAIIVFVVLIKNLNQWANRFRHYMLGHANSVFGNGIGWDKSWALFLSKVMITFFSLMFIVGAYVLILGVL
jgi:hypothetical protein